MDERAENVALSLLWDLYNLDREVIGEHIRGNEMPVDIMNSVWYILFKMILIKIN